MQVSGRVKKIVSPALLEISLAENNSCQTCRSCLTSAMPCEPRTIIVEENGRHQVGDLVELEINNSYYYKGFFLVFVLPLVLLILSMVILNFFKIDQAINLMFSILVFLAAYFFAYRYDKKIADKNLYKLINS